MRVTAGEDQASAPASDGHRDFELDLWELGWPAAGRSGPDTRRWIDQCGVSGSWGSRRIGSVGLTYLLRALTRRGDLPDVLSDAFRDEEGPRDE